MPTIIRLDDDQVDALFAWVESELRTTETAAYNVHQGWTSPTEGWGPSPGLDPAERHQHLQRPSAVLTQCREQLDLLADLKPHLHASTPTGKLARLVLQRLGAGLSARPGYREEWRP